MKDAMLLVVERPHQGDMVVDNMVKYMVGSPFVEKDEIIANGIRTNSVPHMIEDFYSVQGSVDMEHHRRLFHFVLTTKASRVMDEILEDGAEALLEYCAASGHQALLVPHYGSENDYSNHHWHAAVNPINSMTGQRMLDKYETFSAITEYLNQHTRSSWSWRIKKASE